MSALNIECNECKGTPIMGWAYKCKGCEKKGLECYLCEFCYPSDHCKSHEEFEVIASITIGTKPKRMRARTFRKRRK